MTSTALAKDNTAVAPISTCTKLIKSVDPAVPHLSSSTVTSPLENNLGQLDITAFKELAKKFAVKARGQTMLLIESFAQFFDQVRASQGHTPFGIQQVEIYEQMEAYSKALLPNSRISSIHQDLNKNTLLDLTDSTIVVGVLRPSISGLPQALVEIVQGRLLDIEMIPESDSLTEDPVLPSYFKPRQIPILKIESCTPGKPCVTRNVLAAEEDRLFILVVKAN
ncbi:MAG: hypothetical protein KDD35_07720 [Bdellovibrionales bacterium]|nr:hypothetical protein [Bdellovibrionales bacterium]